MSQFVHLHLHTKYSKADGSIQIKELAKKLKNLGMNACAITDHGNMSGIVEFYNTMKENGIKPIIGYESYTDPDGDHLILLAKNNIGYKNLVRICSMENIDGFKKSGKFARGYLNLDEVQKQGLGVGVIAMTACLGGTTSKRLLEGSFVLAEDYVRKLQGIFEEVYIELQDNSTKDQALANMQLQQLSNTTGIPLVITKDAHYLNKEDWEAHDALLAKQINKPIDDPDRWRFPGGPDYYVCSAKEMWDYCIANNIPNSAWDNTRKIADNCNVYLFDEGANKGFYGKSLFPDFPDVPYGYTQDTYLKKLTMDGLLEFITTRPQGYPLNIREYIDRANYELEIICSMGYSGYFLILWDLMKFCRDYRDAEHPNGLGTGTGRGSGVGSLACRSLQITKVDPIKYALLFERFLNPERDSIPDVDLDVADEDRPIVIQYLEKKYGADRVGQIITFTTMKVGGGFRDLMRLKGLSKKEQDEVCKHIPDKFPDQTGTDLNTLLDICVNPTNYTDRFDQKLDQAVKLSDAFSKAASTQPWILKIMEKLEGSITATGSHAGGVLIFPEDSRNLVPSTAPSGAAVVPVCQFDMGIIELIRALKIDVLGLTTSRVISRTATNIIDVVNEAMTPGSTTAKQVINKTQIDIDNINYEDPKVFEMLRNGHTVEVFQFSGGGMTKALMDALVQSIEDLIAIVSLYRPGPMDAIDHNTGMTIYETYINACQTGEDTPTLPRLKHILASSKGNMIYQEQVMQVVMEMGGCSLGYADEIRRACAKKKKKLMEKLGYEFKYGKRKPKIVDGKEEYDPNGEYILRKDGKPIIIGAVHNGFTEQEADNMWEMIKKFAGYAFNKSHAAAYAVNAYQTAYLKLYYPAEYMAQALTAKTTQEEIATDIKECKRLGVPILPPDVNKSDAGFTVEVLSDGRKGIRFGIGAIKGISNIDEIKAARPFTNIEDFFNRVSGRAINKAKAEALILAGAFDSFEPNRHTVYNYYYNNIRKDTAVDPATFESAKANKSKGHDSMYVQKNVSTFCDDDKFEYEKSLMGLYVSGHPLDQYPYKPWSLIAPKEQVECYAVIKNVNIRQDRYGKAYAFFTAETLEDVRECVMWANSFAKYGDRLQLQKGETKKLVLRGIKENGRSGDQFIVNEALVNINAVARNNSKTANNVQPSVQMTPMANPTEALYNTDNVNNIIYGGTSSYDSKQMEQDQNLVAADSVNNFGVQIPTIDDMFGYC